MTTSFDTLDDLPIYDRRDEIVASVDSNQVTIITAETGAGKSTQVPQFLAEHGYAKIIVTQPRILAARNLSARVRQEYSWRQGRDCTNEVGYRTAMERDDHPDNVILYCTDGLQLVRELTGNGARDRQVLVLDEIHEWNENMEVLVAWAKKRCQEDPGFKVVLMSATIEAQSLADYFGAPSPIAVPGRTFPVAKRHGSDVVREITQIMNDHARNLLVFLPGKAEIEQVAEAVRPNIPAGIPILPLHSQLDLAAQQLAFDHYPTGKVILATNVAQTSVTIDDIDCVVDSGLERRSEVRSGVEGLFIAQVSQADCLQRAGRAGRTKPGDYVLAPLAGMPCAPLDERQPYGVPEIMRKHIDRLVLRLAAIGIDVEDLDFYHSPSRKTIKLAKQTLVSLGALTTTGEVTPIGRQMERFPVESSYARMLVEADSYDPALQAKLATIIAIQEVGGIVKHGTRYSGWRRLTRQKRSDLLGHYDVYLAADAIDPTQHEEIGIITKHLAKVAEVNERLNRDLGLGAPAPTPLLSTDTDPLLRCIVAGQLDQIWAIAPEGEAVHLATRQTRELSSGTLVKQAQLVAGRPFDLQVNTHRGLQTLHLVTDVTAVEPDWLGELAPTLFAVKPGKPYFEPRYGAVATRLQITCKGKVFEVASRPHLEHSETAQQEFLAAYAIWLHDRLEKERQALQLLNRRRIPVVKLQQVQGQLRPILAGTVALAELSRQQRFELRAAGDIAAYLGEDLLRGLNKNTHHEPKRHHGRSHRGWRPAHKRRGYDRY